VDIRRITNIILYYYYYYYYYYNSLWLGGDSMAIRYILPIEELQEFELDEEGD